MEHPNFWRTAATSLALTAVLAAGCAPAPAETSLPKPQFNANGELERAVGYREWVYVGTPLTPNDLNEPEANFPEFHNVYIHPDDFAHWSTTGTFQDGTVIVKELITVGSTNATSGIGYFMGDFRGFETTVKDSTRFADEPGNWAYFSYGHDYPLAATATAQPTAACNVCHDVSAGEDWVFTQYYPILRAAKPGSDGEIAVTSAVAPPAAMPAASVSGSDVVPTDAVELFAYLQAGTYKGFASEPEAHESIGPHPSPDLQQSSMVQAFFNSAMDASLRDGNMVHPRGSAIVKEFQDGSGEVSGWAVSVKTEDESDSGQGWYWYEVLSTTDGSDPVAAGNGVALCWGCHFTGRDFVLSNYP